MYKNYNAYVYTNIFCIATLLSSTLLIGYYHALLLKDLDVNFLINKMCSNGFLTTCEQELILAGHSVYQRNYLLLEHMRNMETKALCEFILESNPEVGLQLDAGMYRAIAIL